MHYIFLNSMGHPQAGHMPENMSVLPVQIVVSGQILHAVGLAWAAKLQGQDRVAVTFFGDGATSQGDFHEALNLASVMKVPAIFIVENNQWAISVPFSRQMNTPTIAQRALAYNMEGIRVDGNDIIAVYQTFHDLQQRVRAGSGPALVEAVTYRLGAHTTADDPTRYRAPEDDARQSSGEPLSRLRKYLQHEHIMDTADFNDIDHEAQSIVEKAVETAESYPPESATTAIFDHVYDKLTPSLHRQKDQFSRNLRAKEGNAHG